MGWLLQSHASLLAFFLLKGTRKQRFFCYEHSNAERQSVMQLHVMSKAMVLEFLNTEQSNGPTSSLDRRHGFCEQVDPLRNKARRSRAWPVMFGK